MPARRGAAKKPHRTSSVAFRPKLGTLRLELGAHGDMAWWRSRRRRGAGLALLALLVQIVLSFGHLHLQDLAPAPAATAAVPQTAPAHSPPGHPDNDCPICIAIHMAASGLVAVPPAIAAPHELGRITQTWHAARDISVARYVLFRTRAPPVG